MNKSLNKKTWLGLLAAFFVGFVSACGSNDNDSVGVQVSIPQIKAKAKQKVFSRISVLGGVDETAPFAPADISGFDCLLVNVVGPGIGDWEANKNRVSAGKNFSYIGTYSQLISLATGGEVSVRVKKGASRTIQLIGVRSSDGSCPANITSAQLADTSVFPGLFIVAAQQKDIFQAQEVVLKSTYSVDEASDIRGSESQPIPPHVDQTPPEVPPPGKTGNIVKGEVSQTSIEVSWLSASDRATLSNQLQYRLIATTNASNGLVSDSDIAKATEIMPWTSGSPSSYLATVLEPETNYLFQVLVKDSTGNISKYTPTWIATANKPRYTITYHINDDTASGSAPSDSTQYVKDQKITVASGDAMSKYDYDFAGWNTHPEGSGVSYQPGDQITVSDANINLYAQWEYNPVCTCTDGYYKAGSECVLAENGFWAALCNKSACANKPDNSIYLGSGISSEACPWTCANNYVPNSSFTACNSNSGQVALSCAANQLAVGLSGRSGAWLDKVGVRCQTFENGALTGSVSSGVEYGGMGGGPFSQDCPAGYAVYRVEYGNKDGQTAGIIRFWCRKVSDGTVLAESFPAGGGFYGMTVDGNGTSTITCSSPYYLNWFTMGSAGAYAGAFNGGFGCRSVVSNTGMLAFWQFDNSGEDSSGNSRTLSNSGETTYNSSVRKFGSHSADFNGGTYLDSGVSLINGLNAFSIGGWVYLKSREGGSHVSFWGQNDLIELGLNGSGHPNDVCFWVNGGSEVCSPTKLSLGQWYHVMVTIDASSTKLYLNGSLENSAPISTVGQSSSYSFKIGAKVWDDSNPAYLNGYVDDLIIYNRTLSESEVKQIYGQ